MFSAIMSVLSLGVGRGFSPSILSTGAVPNLDSMEQDTQQVLVDS